MSMEINYPIPENESARLAALYKYQILDSLPEQEYDDLTTIAAQICGTPISVVSLVDDDRQWFKSHYGLDAAQTPRDQAFCSHAIMQPQEVMIVPDALEDERFANNPLVTDQPNIRFYAGAPLLTKDNLPLGTLCVIDRVPRQLEPGQVSALRALSRQVMAQIELRYKTSQLQTEVKARQAIAETLFQKSIELEQTIAQLYKTQTRLIQSEKMSSLGRLVAGIAHEINNPVSFIYGNLKYFQEYVNALFSFINSCQNNSQNISPEIIQQIEEMNFHDISQDLPKLIKSMQNGTTRIMNVVQSLKTFSHLNESGYKIADLHQNLDAIVTLLENSCRGTESYPEIKIIKNYGDIPMFRCDPGLLNQAIMNICNNAIDSLRQKVQNSNELSVITLTTRTVTTESGKQAIELRIKDNGIGISEANQKHLFDPFFTTKVVGKGTGMGLAISYQIITETHKGSLECISQPNEGAEFVINLPI